MVSSLVLTNDHQHIKFTLPLIYTIQFAPLRREAIAISSKCLAEYGCIFLGSMDIQRFRPRALVISRRLSVFGDICTLEELSWLELVLCFSWYDMAPR